MVVAKNNAAINSVVKKAAVYNEAAKYIIMIVMFWLLSFPSKLLVNKTTLSVWERFLTNRFVIMIIFFTNKRRTNHESNKRTKELNIRLKKRTDRFNLFHELLFFYKTRKRKIKTVKRTNLRTAISFAVSPLIFVSSLIENEDLCE